MSSGTNADSLLESMRCLVGTMHLETGPLDISVSIGHALLQSGDAIEAADHAMLRAKRSGRGLVAASDPV